MGGVGVVRWAGVIALVACGTDSGAHEDEVVHEAGVSDPDAAMQDAGRVFDAGRDPKRNQVKPGGICARFAAIQCAGEHFCCDTSQRSPADCNAAMRGLCSELLHLDEVAASPLVNFDLELLGSSLAELERRAALCDPAGAAWALSPEGFAGSIKGTLGSGDDCAPEGGAAAPLDALLIALMSCRSANRLACLPSATGFACAPRSTRNGQCFTDLNCGDGLYCDNPEAGFDGSCMPRKPEQAACAAANECASFLCRAGHCAAEDDVQAAYCTE